jgi:hypothetical protein
MKKTRNYRFAYMGKYRISANGRRNKTTTFCGRTSYFMCYVGRVRYSMLTSIQNKNGEIVDAGYHRSGLGGHNS